MPFHGTRKKKRKKAASVCHRRFAVFSSQQRKDQIRRQSEEIVHAEQHPSALLSPPCELPPSLSVFADCFLLSYVPLSNSLFLSCLLCMSISLPAQDGRFKLRHAHRQREIQREKETEKETAREFRFFKKKWWDGWINLEGRAGVRPCSPTEDLSHLSVLSFHKNSRERIGGSEERTGEEQNLSTTSHPSTHPLVPFRPIRVGASLKFFGFCGRLWSQSLSQSAPLPPFFSPLLFALF
mmetsp:Transcript_27055/g.53082  ORF Transcript_27055/g.53082 Transcript_27055/m.53082 type:complete len:238 (-) Transcript_27055:526-1239(-)